MHQPVKAEHIRRKALLKKHGREAVTFVHAAANMSVEDLDDKGTGGFDKHSARKDVAEQKNKGKRRRLLRKKNRNAEGGSASTEPAEAGVDEAEEEAEGVGSVGDIT